MSKVFENNAADRVALGQAFDLHGNFVFMAKNPAEEKPLIVSVAVRPNLLTEDPLETKQLPAGCFIDVRPFRTFPALVSADELAERFKLSPAETTEIAALLNGAVEHSHYYRKRLGGEPDSGSESESED